MRTCKHIKADGEFCGSPALREREYCYFHLTARGRRLRMQKQIMKGEFHSLQLPTLEDANSIQVALMQVMDALVRGQIDTKVSGQLLYGLQIASWNLAQGARFEEQKSATQAGRYDSFEQDYDLADTECGLKVPEEEEAGETAEETELATAVRELKLARQQRAKLAEAKCSHNEGTETSDTAEPGAETEDEADDVWQCDAESRTVCRMIGVLSQDIEVARQRQCVRRDAGSQEMALRFRPAGEGQLIEQARQVA